MSVGDEKRVSWCPEVEPCRTSPMPVLRPSGFQLGGPKRGIAPLMMIGLFTGLGILGLETESRVPASDGAALPCPLPNLHRLRNSDNDALYSGMGSPSPLQLSLPMLSAGEAVELQVKNIPLCGRLDLSWIGLIAVLDGHRQPSFWSLVDQPRDTPYDVPHPRRWHILDCFGRTVPRRWSLRGSLCSACSHDPHSACLASRKHGTGCAASRAGGCNIS